MKLNKWTPQKMWCFTMQARRWEKICLLLAISCSVFPFSPSKFDFALHGYSPAPNTLGAKLHFRQSCFMHLPFEQSYALKKLAAGQICGSGVRYQALVQMALSWMMGTLITCPLMAETYMCPKATYHSCHFGMQQKPGSNTRTWLRGR